MRERDSDISTRRARSADVPEIAELYRKVYPEGKHYSLGALESQIASFSEGVFVVVRRGRIAGYCATILQREQAIWTDHTWRGITGGGFGHGHDPRGRWLYGYEVFVDPEQRRQGLGRRLYQARVELCRRLGLKGIAICGRLPLLSERLPSVGSVQAYVKAVQARDIPDPTFRFQTDQGFEFQKILPGYLPSDRPSLGYGAFLVWRNPALLEPASRIEVIRGGAVGSTQALAASG